MILACARFRSFVLSESFNPETSYWTDPYSVIRRNNHSFHDMHFYNTRSSIIHIMQNLKAYSNLKPDNQSLKNEDRETSKERWLYVWMYFQIQWI